MEKYLLEINSNYDLDEIEDVEEREEAQEQYEDEIEKVYYYLNGEVQCYISELGHDEFFEFEQIDDYRFNISIDDVTPVANKIMNQIDENLTDILSKYDRAYSTFERYKEA